VGKLITFDVWGTLILPDREKFMYEICKAIVDVLTRHGYNTSIQHVAEIYTNVDREVREIRLRELTFIPPEQSVRLLLERITGQRPSMKLVDEVHDAICRVVEEGTGVKPAPGVYELLDKLVHDGHVLALVSNVVFWRSYATRRLLGRFGLQRYFQYEFYADIVKEVKPSTRMLTLVEREAKMPVTTHVGDSFTEDVTMALACRVRAVLIDRRRQFLNAQERSKVLLNGSLVIVSSLDVLLEDDMYRVITS